MSSGVAAKITLSVRQTGTGYPGSLFAPSELAIKSGEITVLVGASGSGKSTLLRLLAGLEDLPGEFVLDGIQMPCKRAYMTQDVRLLPWFSVRANAGIGNRLRGGQDDHKAVSEILDRLDLSRDAEKLPAEISGGMAQRTALARTLLERADLNLLDEPFAALDAITRRNMQDLTRQHFAGKTVVMVTHDPIEAVRLGDAIYVLSRNEAGGAASIVPFDNGGTDDAARAESLFARLQAA